MNPVIRFGEMDAILTFFKMADMLEEGIVIEVGDSYEREIEGKPICLSNFLGHSERKGHALEISLCMLYVQG